MNATNIQPYSRAVVKLLKGIVEKDDVVWNDVFERTVVLSKTAGYRTQTSKTQFLIKPERRHIACDHRIELQDAIPHFLCLFHAVANEFLSDSLAAMGTLHRITCVTDVSASPYIIRMQNVHPNNFPAPDFPCNAGKRL